MQRHFKTENISIILIERFFRTSKDSKTQVSRRMKKEERFCLYIWLQ